MLDAMLSYGNITESDIQTEIKPKFELKWQQQSYGLLAP